MRGTSTMRRAVSHPVLEPVALVSKKHWGDMAVTPVEIKPEWEHHTADVDDPITSMHT